MTKQDYILIAQCIAETKVNNYDLNDTIGYFSYRLHIHPSAKKFNPTKFKSYILKKTKPDHIPEEQAEEWLRKKLSKNQ